MHNSAKTLFPLTIAHTDFHFEQIHRHTHEQTHFKRTRTHTDTDRPTNFQTLAHWSILQWGRRERRRDREPLEIK